MEMTAHQLQQTPSEQQFSYKTTLDNLNVPSTDKEDSPHPSTSEPPKPHVKCFKSYGREENQPQTPKMPLCVDAYDVCKPLGRMAAMDSNSLIMLGR